ncbi:hypothetical protein [Pandoraea sp. E26]|uniref:hypothetical protein n=1 Tax=Pandoraea sp. E26 TaxID=1427365 RepID=UPI0004907E35|nr:hypothetical protein [Pandoraea sp. E26]
MANSITEIVRAFDRIKIYVDNRLPAKKIEQRLLNLCTDITIVHPINRFQRIWATKIELRQPTPEAFIELSNMLGTRYLTRVSYAEVAIDWLTSDNENAAVMAEYLLEHMVVPRARERANIEEETVYFNRRTNKNGNLSPHVPVLYADRPSKLLARRYPEPCCHFEHRFNGHAACSSIGLNTLADCIAFDHHAFWRSTLRLCEFSSKMDLGAALSNRSDLTASALRNRAANFLQEHRVEALNESPYVLHNCVRAKPVIRRALRAIDNRHLLEPRPRH